MRGIGDDDLHHSPGIKKLYSFIHVHLPRFVSGDAHTSDSYFMYHYRSDVGSDLEVADAPLV